MPKMFLTIGLLLAAVITVATQMQPAQEEISGSSQFAAVSSDPNATPKGADHSLVFAVYQTDKASSVFRRLAPVIHEVERRLTEDLGNSVRIDLRILEHYEDVRNGLAGDEIDFARLGPASYVLTKEQSPGIRLLAMEQQDGRQRFLGHIVVRERSKIRTLEDLRGRTFAFGDPTSTIGRYLSQAFLADSGVHASDLSSFDYLGRHDLVFKSVEMGDHDAGALKDATFKKMNTDGALRILASFENVTKPWVARPSLPHHLTAALRRALCAISDPSSLSALKVDRLVEPPSNAYQLVRRGMTRSRAFGRPRSPE